VGLSFDANDPLQLGQFWAKSLGWDIHHATRDQVDLRASDGPSFRITVLAVSETKVNKNPIHLDLSTTSIDDQRDTVARLIELGASHLDIAQSPEEPHMVLADPEGNEFCVLEPGNSFVDDSRRLGSITCDGSRDVGYFWSKTLEWPLVWDQDEETAVRLPDGTGPFITWGPPIPAATTNSRLHLDIAPNHADFDAEVERLTSIGAVSVEVGRNGGWVVMADPDGTEFRLLKL